jgi:hypothetical protein
MAGRVTSDLLLVGSLPVGSTEQASGAGRALRDLVFALPGGETGHRAAWVGYERERLAAGRRCGCRRGDGVTDGIPRHAHETPIFGRSPG